MVSQLTPPLPTTLHLLACSNHRFKKCCLLARRLMARLLFHVDKTANRVRKIRRRKTRLWKFRLIGERQCTLKGQARYVNVRGSVQWKGVYRVGGRYWGVQNLTAAKFPEASFPTANLFTANFPRTTANKGTDAFINEISMNKFY